MNLLILKLEGLDDLPDADRRILQAVTANSRTVEAKQDLIAEGDVPDDVHLVLDGFACRYKLLADGETADLCLSDPRRFPRPARLHP